MKQNLRTKKLEVHLNYKLEGKKFNSIDAIGLTISDYIRANLLQHNLDPQQVNYEYDFSIDPFTDNNELILKVYEIESDADCKIRLDKLEADKIINAKKKLAEEEKYERILYNKLKEKYK